MSALELVRWALYADLGMVFGVPVAAVLVRADAALLTMRPILAMAVLLALPLAVLGFLLTVARMAGAGLADIDRTLLLGLTTETSLGWAFLVRIAALAFVTTALAWPPERLRYIAVPAAIALGSLAWSGHAAASEGAFAVVRIAGDIIHLLAASLWIGALALFLAMLWNDRGDESPPTAAALSRFSGVGSILVAVLLVTGLGNLLFLAAPATWPALLDHPYGRLLLIKLCAFAGMLGLAAANRFRLVPRLNAAVGLRQAEWAVRTLRRSIAMETILAIGILLLVARLGLLDPSGG